MRDREAVTRVVVEAALDMNAMSKASAFAGLLSGLVASGDLDRANAFDLLWQVFRYHNGLLDRETLLVSIEENLKIRPT